MALIGSIEEIGITDILQLLALSQKTGILAVRNERNEEVGVLYFKEGRIAYGRLKAQNMKERLLQENRIAQGVDPLRQNGCFPLQSVAPKRFHLQR